MHTQHIGDLLITYKGQESSVLARSSSPWQTIAQLDKTQLMTTRPDDGWRGFPLTTHTDDRWQIWALGEFCGNLHPDLPQALKTSADLNGHFVIFGYHKTDQHWHVLTNRFGTVHAYVANEGTGTALGTFSPAVAAAAAARQLDWSAIGGFFQFGFFLSDQTFWHNVHILEPATHTIFDADGNCLTQHKTWTWYHQPNHDGSHADALKAFADQFHQVIAEEVQGKTVAVPISGGLDSRSTLIPLTDSSLTQAEKLVYFSYGFGQDSIETQIATQLANKRALDLSVWQIRPYLFDQVQRVLSATEGYQDITLSRQADVVGKLGEQATHVLAAHWMDVWLDDMGFLATDSPLSDEALTAKMVKKFTKNGAQVLLPLVRDWLPAEQDQSACSKINAALKPLQGIQDLDFKVKAWKTQQWSFRWTLASLRTYQLGVFPLVPFYDHRLADFFCRMPSEVMRERAFQIAYLKRYAPDLARVPWQAYYDANLYEYPHFNTWLLPRRALIKLRRTLSGQPVIQRNWEVQFLNPSGRAGLQDWLLTPGLKLHNYVDKQHLASFLADFYSAPGAANGYAVSMLLTLSAWMEAYG